jgi:hypothetical protein
MLSIGLTVNEDWLPYLDLKAGSAYGGGSLAVGFVKTDSSTLRSFSGIVTVALTLSFFSFFASFFSVGVLAAPFFCAFLVSSGFAHDSVFGNRFGAGDLEKPAKLQL